MLVVKADDGRYFHILPVFTNQQAGPGGNPLASLPPSSTFTFYEKPLKGFTVKQFCTPGENGREACYREVLVQ